MSKLFGNLTLQHLRELVQLVPLIDKHGCELRELISVKREKFRELTGGGIQWSGLYEKPFRDLLEHFLTVAGVGSLIMDVLGAQDSVQRLIDSAADDADPGEWSGGASGQFQFSDLLAAYLAVQFNLQSLMLYGRYLNDFVAQARDGDDPALFKAIRVDLSVVSTPTAAQRIGRAVFEDDQPFIADLRKAMAGKTGNQAAYLRRFRFLMTALHEGGGLRLPTRELEALVFEVGVYKDGPGARKNVQELIRKAVKEHAI